MCSAFIRTFVLCLVLVNSGCSTEDETSLIVLQEETDRTPIYSQAGPTWDFAKATIDQIDRSPRFRHLLIEQLNAKFDGDYNVLGIVLQNARMDNNHKLNDLASEYAENILDDLVRDNPLWHIAAFSPDFKDIPIDFLDDLYQIAIIPNTIHGGQVPVIRYDRSIDLISATDLPTIPTLYIRQNERVVAVPRQSKDIPETMQKNCELEPVANDDDTDYYLDQDYYGNCGYIPPPPPPPPPPGGTGGPKSFPPFPCDNSPRTIAVENNTAAKERMTTMQLANMDVFDHVDQGWFDGNKEFRVMVAFGATATTVGSTTGVFHMQNHQLKDCAFLGKCETEAYTVNYEHVTWQSDIHGINMSYTWQEIDPGDPTTIAIPITVPNSTGSGSTTIATVTFTSTDRSEFLGTQIVEFCDDLPFTYDDASVHFTLQ